MKQFLLLFATLPFLLVGCSSSSTTSPGGGGEGGGGSNADKIVGVWKVAKRDGKAPPADSQMTLEFTKDGKFRFREGKDVEEFDYKVEGDKLATTKGKESRTDTIKSISGNSMVLVTKEGTWELEK